MKTSAHQIATQQLLNLNLFLSRHYGIEGEITPLAGELDLNFKLLTAEGTTYLLKLYAPDREGDFIDFQAALLEYINSQAVDFSPPKLIKTQQGAATALYIDSEGQKRKVQLLSWIAGHLWNHFWPQTLNLHKDLGVLCGQHTSALKEFNHDYAKRTFDWDIANVLWTKNHLKLLVITLILFLIIGLNLDVSGTPNISEQLEAIGNAFNISPLLFIVPLIVIALIVKKTPPLVALLLGTLLAAIAAIIAQPHILTQIAGVETLDFKSTYKGVMQAMTVDTAVETSSSELNDLFSSGGMSGMLGTIWLIICAMVFGGVMDAIGALSRISKALLSLATTTFGLFASTVASCLALNVTASDQYLALVVPGKMFKKAYQDKGLAPENLSRTLEDSGTVTSVLVPWNTCGAYQSGVLGVSVADYFLYAFFNWISPFMTLLVAAVKFKIKTIKSNV